MNLLEQSLWWLLPFILLILAMVHAMMEFTVSLLARPPRKGARPISVKELRARLLTLNRSEKSYRLTEGVDCDLEIKWQSEETPRIGRFAIARSGMWSHVRFLLDESRHELRMNHVSQSHSFFLGFVRWLPHVSGYISFQAGPPGQSITDEISQVANKGGWGVRPMLWWFQTTHRGYRVLERITPAPFRRLPARLFWGCLYPLCYVASIVYIVLVVGPLEERDVMLVLGVSAVWWGMWGLLTWALLGFPPFWRRWRT
jgi:hypothetical protein